MPILGQPERVQLRSQIGSNSSGNSVAKSCSRKVLKSKARSCLTRIDHFACDAVRSHVQITTAPTHGLISWIVEIRKRMPGKCRVRIPAAALSCVAR